MLVQRARRKQLLVQVVAGAASEPRRRDVFSGCTLPNNAAELLLLRCVVIVLCWQGFQGFILLAPGFSLAVTLTAVFSHMHCC